jgi:hypothetical protein
MFAEAARGELPQFPTIELYQHTGVDPSLQVRCACNITRSSPSIFGGNMTWCEISLSSDMHGYDEQDAEGHHNSALFVGPVPYQPAGSSWDEQLNGYVRHLLSICDRFAPGDHCVSELAVVRLRTASPEPASLSQPICVE